MDIRNCRRFYFQFLLTFLLLSGILYMISFESFAGIRDDAPALVFPIKYNAGNFLQRKSTKITFPRPDQLFNETSFKLHLPTRSNGSLHKFLPASEPADRYVININDMGPQVKVKEFFTSVGKLSCYKDGLNMSAVRSMSKGSVNRLKICPCLPNYYGSQCSIPGCVYKVPKNRNLPFRLLSDARRVVMGIVVNHELQMTEIRIRMLASVVDIFIIAESNVSASGDAKPLYFFEAFKAGFLDEFQHKILYVYQDQFPRGYVENGWKADDYIRTYMSQHGMPRIAGLSPEDLFLNFDADEIPKAEAVLFLKLHWGFQQPIRMKMRSSIFGYFYTHIGWGEYGVKGLNMLSVGCTVLFLSDVCGGDAILLRRRVSSCPNWQRYSAGHDMKFDIGVLGDFGGHHCSWCFSASGIRYKLASAQRSDPPRWGDYPEKLNLDYIESLRRTGSWFDGTTPTIETNERFVPDFAPRYALEQRERYRELLVHPDSLKLPRNTAS